jgi:hypothetical protein
MLIPRNRLWFSFWIALFWAFVALSTYEVTQDIRLVKAAIVLLIIDFFWFLLIHALKDEPLDSDGG